MNTKSKHEQTEDLIEAIRRDDKTMAKLAVIGAILYTLVLTGIGCLAYIFFN